MSHDLVVRHKIPVLSEGHGTFAGADHDGETLERGCCWFDGPAF